MSTTLEQIESFFLHQGFKYILDSENNLIETSFVTENYTNAQGEHYLPVVVELQEEGQFIQIYVPQCYEVSEVEYRSTVLQVLLMISWRTKMVQFELDAQSNTVRVMVEFPLEDALLTKNQLMRSIMGLLQTIERFHPIIQIALVEGRVDFDILDKPSIDIDIVVEHFRALVDILETMGVNVQEILQASQPENETSDDDEFI